MTKHLRVNAAMRTPDVMLSASMNPALALQVMNERGASQLPVSDGSRFVGMMAKPELQRASPEDLEIRQLIKNVEFPHVHADHTLDVALHRMGSNGIQELPVVSRRDVHKLEGLISLNDVLRLYGFDQSKAL